MVFFGVSVALSAVDLLNVRILSIKAEKKRSGYPLVTCVLLNHCWIDESQLSHLCKASWHICRFPEGFHKLFGHAKFILRWWLIQSHMRSDASRWRFHNSSKSLCPTPPPLFPSVFLLVLSDKFWYCRLSPNHKVLHYGDLEESPQGEVPHDSLQDKCKCQGKLLIAFTNYCETVSIQMCVVWKHAWSKYIVNAQ